LGDVRVMGRRDSFGTATADVRAGEAEVFEVVDGSGVGFLRGWKWNGGGLIGFEWVWGFASWNVM
jgi:hypothetical protein